MNNTAYLGIDHRPKLVNSKDPPKSNSSAKKSQKIRSSTVFILIILIVLYTPIILFGYSPEKISELFSYSSQNPGDESFGSRNEIINSQNSQSKNIKNPVGTIPKDVKKPKNENGEKTENSQNNEAGEWDKKENEDFGNGMISGKLNQIDKSSHHLMRQNTGTDDCSCHAGFEGEDFYLPHSNTKLVLKYTGNLKKRDCIKSKVVIYVPISTSKLSLHTELVDGKIEISNQVLENVVFKHFYFSAAHSNLALNGLTVDTFFSNVLEGKLSGSLFINHALYAHNVFGDIDLNIKVPKPSPKSNLILKADSINGNVKLKVCGTYNGKFSTNSFFGHSSVRQYHLEGSVKYNSAHRYFKSGHHGDTTSLQHISSRQSYTKNNDIKIGTIKGNSTLEFV
ncbi:hypothetical protein AYI68_g2583 [Smittium mucronatum]|uniref:Adhesin domain-containing protein n=1 Tax=Smittium mucronatum TaxID=133383 RepID=A0A1R0H2B3_9FUNG|nr:hypothetical protein AYI68_g2583 [Smittium mucronatum]